MTELRTMTGVCPQQNILFDDLSPVEHLKFFGMIKGITGDKLQSEVRLYLDRYGWRQAKRSLMALVVVIPKEGWVRPHTPILLLI